MIGVRIADPTAAMPASYDRFITLARWASDSAPWLVPTTGARGEVLVAALSGVATTVGVHRPGPTGACEVCINDPHAPSWPGPWPCSVVRLLARDLVGPLERLASAARKAQLAHESGLDLKGSSALPGDSHPRYYGSKPSSGGSLPRRRHTDAPHEGDARYWRPSRSTGSSPERPKTRKAAPAEVADAELLKRVIAGLRSL